MQFNVLISCFMESFEQLCSLYLREQKLKIDSPIRIYRGASDQVETQISTYKVNFRLKGDLPSLTSQILHGTYIASIAFFRS